MHTSFLRFFICLALSLHAPGLLGAVRGVVFDVHGEPLAGADVTTHRWETPVGQRMRILADTARPVLAAATTDEHGAFSLDPKIIGMIELRVEHEGFAPARQLTLADDENAFVELTPAAPRTGRVTANGKPVGGALVTAYSQSSIVWTTRTRDDGTYTIADPKTWCSALTFVHPDHAPLVHDDTSRLDVSLEPGATIVGVVNDRRGRAVPKAMVFAGLWTTTTTAEDGAFVLRHVASAEKQITAFDGPSFGTAPRDAKNVILRIDQLASISGTVRDANQRPLEGVPVYGNVASSHAPSSWRETNVAITDSKGNYSLQHCDAVEYIVTAYGAAALDFESASATLRNRTSARADLTATKSELIVGTVFDERRHPISGAIVQYTMPQLPLIYGYLSNAAQMPSGRSGSDGKFKLPRYKELIESAMTVRLQALRRGYAVGVSEPLKRDAATVSIMLPAGIELTGVVTDAAGKPVAGAGVALLQDPSGAMPMPVESVLSTGVMRAFAESDASGRFSVRLNSAPHDLGVWKEGYPGVRLGNLNPKAGDEPLKIVIEPGVEIRGRVTSKDSTTSLAGTILARNDEASMVTTKVAADGTFTISALRPGSYTVSYTDENGSSVERQTKAPIEDLVLELPPRGVIRGRVVDAATGEVLRSYSVKFQSEMEVIEGESNFTLKALPDTGQLTVNAAGYVKGTTQVTVEAGKTAEITITLARGRAADGRIIDEKGSPVASAWVSLDSDSYDAMDHTSKEGEFHLDGLPREALAIEVRANGHLLRELEVAPGDHDVRLDVVLSRGRKVNGHVFTNEGAPVDGATVTASGEASQSATTDATGAYTIEGLTEGPYALQATLNELQSEEVPLGNETPGDLVLVMKPSAGAGKVHGTVSGFSGHEWNFGVVRADDAQAFAMIGRDGKYTIERAPAGALELRAWASSVRGEATTAPVKVTVIAGGDVEANLVFRDDIKIRGVVTESGEAAPGRKVRFRSSMMNWSTVTGERGDYELTGVEPGLLYDVEVEGGGRSYSTRYQVTGSGTFDIRIEWSRVEGRVVDATGTPIAGANVELATEEKRGAGTTTTDATGAFAFPAKREPHVITVAKEAFATFTGRVEAGAAPLLVTMTRSNGLRVRLTDARSSRTLDGYVVAVNAAGLPVARASDAQKDGAMLVPLAEGAYRISVSADGYASQSVRASVPHDGELRLALTPGGTLIVQADRSSGDLVRLVLPNGEEYVRCQCNGIAEIRLAGTTTTIEHVAPGAYTMQVLDARGLVKITYPVTIVEGQTTHAEIRVPE